MIQTANYPVYEISSRLLLKWHFDLSPALTLIQLSPDIKGTENL
jgi:hypothetical protein